MTGGSSTILLVEGNEDLRQVTAELLEILGHRVFSAAEGDAAARLFHRLGDQIDLLLTDAVLGDMCGFALAGRLLRSKPDLGVVVLATRGEDRALRPRLQTGRFGFLPKPFNVDELIRELAEALRLAAMRLEPSRSELALSSECA